MKKEITVELDNDLYNQLLNHCGGNKEDLQRFIVEVISKMVESYPKSSKQTKLDASGLNDYLQSSQPGNRGYGAKGQGW